jgi:hypothetical protein
LDFSGNSKIIYKNENYFMSGYDNISMPEENIICVEFRENEYIPENFEFYWYKRGNIYLDLSQNYKLVKTEILDTTYEKRIPITGI